MNDTNSSPEPGSTPADLLDTTRANAGGAGSMKMALPVLLLLALLLTGCARTYVITMNNGARITTRGKPKLQGASYVFKDAKGQQAQVSAGRVREIAPASMAKEEGAQFFK